MSSPTSGGGGRAPSTAQTSSYTASEMIARVQHLAEMKRAPGAYPADWVVEAYYLGDMTALAAVSIRSERPVS